MRKCSSTILYAACTFRPYKSTPVLKLFRTFTGKMTRGLSLRMVFSLLFQDTLFIVGRNSPQEYSDTSTDTNTNTNNDTNTSTTNTDTNSNSNTNTNSNTDTSTNSNTNTYLQRHTDDGEKRCPPGGKLTEPTKQKCHCRKDIQ